MEKRSEGGNTEDEDTPGRIPIESRWCSQVRKCQECLIKALFLKVWAGCQESTKAGQCPESYDGCLVTVSKPGGCR